VDTEVVDRFGQPVGTVDRVLLHYNGLFDGLIVRTDAGLRFVDAPEVRRISGGVVTLGVTAADVKRPGDGAERRYGVVAARHDRLEVTESDRDAVIVRLKQAFVDDELTAEELGDRIVVAHVAESLDELDAALDGIR
jgi:Domain of unknown function (DUF1707)